MRGIWQGRSYFFDLCWKGPAVLLGRGQAGIYVNSELLQSVFHVNTRKKLTDSQKFPRRFIILACDGKLGDKEISSLNIDTSVAKVLLFSFTRRA